MSCEHCTGQDGLKATGEADEATLEKLEEVHGS